MTDYDAHSEDIHPVEAENGGYEAERLIDEAATIFARLFLEQYQYNKRSREKNQE